MPTVTISVGRVLPRQVRLGTGSRTKYDVIAAREAGQASAPAFETWDAEQARLCMRARELGRQVTIGYRETGYGREIATLHVEKPT